MTKTVRVLLLLMSYTWVCSTQAGSGLLQATDLKQVECWFETGKDWPETRCFYMQVPERYGKANSNTIKFPVVQFVAEKTGAEKSPVLHLGGGGPGNPVGIDTDNISQATWKNYHNMSLAIGRDLYIIDPRGVGMARPVMFCSEYTARVKDILKKALTLTEEVNRLVDAYKQCHARLAAAGHDLSAYNSLHVARDIRALSIALKIDKWNLYGVSYGTRYALTIAREFPELVETMILDGTVFPNIRYQEKTAQNFASAFNKGFGHCAKQKSCAEKFPELEKRFWSLVERLNAKPVTVFVTNPYTYEKLEVRLTGYRLMAVVFNALYDESFHAEFPSLVASLEHGNTDMVANTIRKWLKFELDEQYGDAGAISHYCYEEYPFVDLGRARKNTAGIKKYIRELVLAELSSQEDMCKVWNIDSIDAREGKPIVTEIPTLFLHGELDPVLPAEDLKGQLQYFPRHAFLIFGDISHDVIGGSVCAEQAAGQFIEHKFDYLRHIDCI